MKTILFSVFFLFLSFSQVRAQISADHKQKSIEIHALINAYSSAREAKDTIRLKEILAKNIDQLVSSGEWRIGIEEALPGMIRSSTSNPGSRTLEVEKIKFLSEESALVDARYSIKSPNEAERNMWSTFLVIKEKKQWKITAIRNMLPAKR